MAVDGVYIIVYTVIERTVISVKTLFTSRAGPESKERDSKQASSRQILRGRC